MNRSQRLTLSKSLSRSMKQAGLGVQTAQRRLFQYLSGNAPIFMEDSSHEYIKSGYEFNPHVYAVVNHITNAMSSVPPVVNEVVDEEKARKYYRLKQNRRYKTSQEKIEQAAELKEEAFEEVGPDDDLTKLIEKPNPLQAWPEFFENLMGFKFVTGNTYAHGIELTDGRFGEMWVLPPQYTRLKADASFETVVKAYILEIYGRSSEDIPPENVMHLKYWNPDYSHTGSHLYGMSPLKAARRVIRSSNDGLQAMAKAFNNMGASGMVYPDDENVELGEKQQGQVQKFFDQQGSGPDNYKRALVMSAKMGWTNFGMSPVDLEIIEGSKMSMRDICNVYSFPSELLNDPDNKTNTNKRESRRQLWLDVGIPSLERSYSELNRWLTKPYVDADGKQHEARYPNRHIDYDVSGIEALADDMKSKSEWVSRVVEKMGLPPNRGLEEMGFDPVDDPSFDEPWIGMGRMPLSQVTGGLGELDDDAKALLKAEYTNGHDV